MNGGINSLHCHGVPELFSGTRNFMNLRRPFESSHRCSSWKNININPFHHDYIITLLVPQKILSASHNIMTVWSWWTLEPCWHTLKDPACGDGEAGREKTARAGISWRYLCSSVLFASTFPFRFLLAFIDKVGGREAEFQEAWSTRFMSNRRWLSMELNTDDYYTRSNVFFLREDQQQTLGKKKKEIKFYNIFLDARMHLWSYICVLSLFGFGNVGPQYFPSVSQHNFAFLIFGV